MKALSNKNFLYRMVIWMACCLLFWACEETASQQANSSEKTYHRIVSLSGAITETLYTLGHGDKIVGVDVTSPYPAEANGLPKLGHISQLNAEGVMSLEPDLIIAEATEDANRTLALIKKSNLEILWLEKPGSLDAPLQMATKIAAKLGDPTKKLETLSQKIETEQQELQTLTANLAARPKVLFIYARGKGNLMVAGRNTPAEAMITAAGGQNAITEFEDFRALSAEGLIEAQPDAILMFESGLQSLNGTDALLAVPGVGQTPAGKHRNIIAMDGHYLLGFGPRATQAAVELARKLQDQEIEY